jgi:ankyrin repeat protein
MQSHDQLFQALHTEDYSGVEYLLKIKQISVNQMDSHYQTPLMIACQQNSGPLTRLCLEYGARIDEFPEPLPTALHSAARSRSFECMSILIQSAQQSPLRLADLVNRRDSDGNTALHLSAYHGDANIIELLVYHGGDITIEDSYGRNALHLSALYGSRRSLMVLLDQGGDSALDLTDTKGYTPLHYCAEGGYLDCVHLLLGAAADPSLRTLEGFSSHDLAAHHNQSEICQVIEQYTQANNPNSSDEESVQQNELFTFTSSLREDSAGESDEEEKTELRGGVALTAARALQLAMSNSETQSSQEETRSREYQLHLLDNGLYSEGGVRDDDLIEQSEQWIGATEAESTTLPPLEEFQLNDCWWQVYVTDEGYQYFLKSDTQHSQWEDPRMEGILEDSSAGLNSSSPKVPVGLPRSPKNISSPTVALANNDHETVEVQSRKSSAEKRTGSGKKFNRPRQLHSPLRLHFSKDPSPDTLSSPSPSPRPIVDRTHPHSAVAMIGKTTAWMETSTPTQSPLKSPVKLLPTMQSRDEYPINSFSPDRLFADRAKSLRKNAPFPLTSPPPSLRVAAMRAHHELSAGEPWATPTRRVQQPTSSPSGFSSSPKRIGRNHTLTDRSQNSGRSSSGRESDQSLSEDLAKDKSFEFRDGSYGCGGNMYGG